MNLTASRKALQHLSPLEFWQEQERLWGRQRFGEFLKLAELVMVMLLGSVEDERMFSAMNEVRPEPPAQQAAAGAPDVLRSGVDI